MDESQNSVSLSRYAEMHERSKIARTQFLQDLKDVPKLPAVKLIMYIGWSIGMSALDNTIVNIANPSIQRWHRFVPSGEIIPQSTI